MKNDRMSAFEAASRKSSASRITTEDRRSYVYVSGSPEFHDQALWRHIEEAGHAVRRFTDDRELLDAVRTGSPSAIVYEMPAKREGAIEFLNRLTELKQDVCVIVVGPEVGAELVAQCLRYGAFDYLAVPVAATRLMTSLHSVDIGLPTLPQFPGRPR